MPIQEILVRRIIAEQLIEVGNREGAKATLKRLLELSPGDARGLSLLNFVSPESSQNKATTEKYQPYRNPKKRDHSKKVVKQRLSRPEKKTKKRAAKSTSETWFPATVDLPISEPALQLQQATVTVSSQPAATLLLDGKSLGRTPVSNQKVKPGSHVVTASAVGYLSKTKTFSASANGHVELRFDLTPVPRVPQPKQLPKRAVETQVSETPHIPKSNYYVIAHRNTNLRSLSVSSLRNIFLGTKRYWSSGRRIVPLLRPIGVSAGRRLFRRVVKMDTTAFEQYWDRLELAGEAISPKSISGAARLARVISKRSGSISIISARELDKVKGYNVLLIPISL